MANFLQRLFSQEKPASVKPEVKQTSSPAFLPLSDRSILGISDLDLTSGQLQKYYQSWFYAGTSLRAEEVAAIDLRLFKNAPNGDVKEIDSHDSLDVLQAVNAMATRYDLFYSLQTFKDIYGEAFWWLLKDGNKIVGIYPWLQPARMGIELADDGQVKGYIYQVPGNREFITFPADEIVHFKRFNPKDPYRGLSLVRAAQYALGLEREAQNWNYKFFENSAQPAGVVSFPTKLDREQQELLRSQWGRMHEGTAKSHRIAILTHDGKYTATGLSQKDMDFLEQQKYGRDQILSILRTPLAVINPDESINRATAEAAQSYFFERVVKPQLLQIVNTLNEFYLPHFDKTGQLYFDFWNEGPRDVEAALRSYEVGINTGSLSPNEIRELEGRDPIPDGDNYYLPFNLMPIGEAPEQEEVRQLALKRKQKTIRKHLHVKRSKSLAEKLYPEAKALAEALRKKQAKNNEQRTERREQMVVTEENKEQRRKLGEGFVQMQKARSNREEVLVQQKLRKEFNRQERQVLASLGEKAIGYEFDEEAEGELFAKIFSPIMRDIVKAHGEDALQLLGERGFVVSDAVREFLKTKGLEFTTDIQSTTKDKINSAIAAGVDANEGIPDIKKRIEAVFSDAKGYRAKMIARTEVSRSSNFGISEGYVQSEVVEKKEWFTPLGEDLEVCVPMEGVTVGLKEGFDLPNGETVDDPPAHPNCVCRTLPIVDERKMKLSLGRPLIIESKIIDEETTEKLERVAKEGEEQIEGLKKIREALEKEVEQDERHEQIDDITKPE